MGNPPFAGKNTLIAGNRLGYLDWLKTLHDESHGNADLVAHFFRRAFNLLRPDGCFGLIATNTIGQGDTRSTGLRWLCTHGGTIYSARKRYKWPGLAAVVVSVVHVCKGPAKPPFILDGRGVPIITAYLFHAGGHDDAKTLRGNDNVAFRGSYVASMGFAFDDNDSAGVSSALAVMHELVKRDPRNGERIFPYLGGEEVNTDPAQAQHRYIINFGEMEEAEARCWPDLMQIVERKVKPDRDRNARDARRIHWWRYGEYAPGLYAAISRFEHVIAISQVAPQHAFASLPAGCVFGHTLNVLALDSHAAFLVLQSRVHEVWSRLHASSLKDDMRYTISDCFGTFPFPAGVLESAATDQLATSTSLDTIGRDYYDFRAALMIRNNEGLTKTYNRFHDPNERSADILKLRELHAAMDRAVLEAYAWHDLALRATCAFLLDYEDDDDEEEPASSGRRARRKPWRYRWPDDFRDEVLARLLALNAARAAAERLTAAASAKPKRAGRKKRSGDSEQGKLLE